MVKFQLIFILNTLYISGSQIFFGSCLPEKKKVNHAYHEQIKQHFLVFKYKKLL